MNKLPRTANTIQIYLGVGMIYRSGHTLATARRMEDDGPMSIEQISNARREAEYVARRNGVKEPLLQLWKVMH